MSNRRIRGIAGGKSKSKQRPHSSKRISVKTSSSSRFLNRSKGSKRAFKVQGEGSKRFFDRKSKGDKSSNTSINKNGSSESQQAYKSYSGNIRSKNIRKKGSSQSKNVGHSKTKVFSKQTLTPKRRNASRKSRQKIIKNRSIERKQIASKGKDKKSDEFKRSKSESSYKSFISSASCTSGKTVNDRKGSCKAKTANNNNKRNGKTKKKTNNKNNNKNVRSKEANSVTLLIAPKDYEHIYKGRKSSQHTNKVSMVQSDVPTILLAPDDYEHIYEAKMKGNFKAVKRRTNDDDMPTMLMAPDDYEHIYKANKVETNNILKSRKKTTHIPDDAPTVLKLWAKAESGKKVGKNSSKSSDVNDDKKRLKGKIKKKRENMNNICKIIKKKSKVIDVDNVPLQCDIDDTVEEDKNDENETEMDSDIYTSMVAIHGKSNDKPTKCSNKTIETKCTMNENKSIIKNNVDSRTSRNKEDIDNQDNQNRCCRLM
ncbi:hypothetical protein RDWZM_001406 [Blomia tropicalis]|uniref:Uncharacterized protein n=1 Tax=Blomia tropicalis TaxID=40697 RepID=A0A9Q0RQL2_BLOTA|nr:hypothetical protein RDWZM_001406 [Blomia tropicalis]